MTTVSHIPLQEYLASSYRPDREYVDGEIRERNVGKWEHVRVQALLAAWFVNHESAWGTTCSTEQRVRVSDDRIRVPDLVVLPASPQPDVLTEPPLLVIEILSPDDPFSRVLRKCHLYETWGIRQVVVVDPQARLVWSYENGAPRETDVIARRGDRGITAQELWEEIDRYYQAR